MTRVVQINTGVIIKQDQNNSNPVSLPNSSVGLSQLATGARQAIQNTSLTVGSGGDVANGAADYSSLITAIAALPTGGKIFVRNSYIGAENISITTNDLSIEGQGHLTVVGTITISGDTNSITNLKHGNLTLNSGADKNLINNTWLASGSTITDSGIKNEVRCVEE